MKKRDSKLPPVIQVTAELWTGTQRCCQVLNFWSADKGTAEVSSGFLEAGNLQKHHIHILDTDGNILQVEHDQPFLFSTYMQKKSYH